MKKIIPLLVLFILLFVLNGCRANNSLDDDNNTTNDNTGDIDLSDDKVPLGTANNDANQTMPSNDNSPYVTSLHELDTGLRSGLTDIEGNKIDVNDKDYLSKQADYYSKRASMYRDALNNVNKLKYSDTNTTNHNAIVSYYQSGYDTYNNLSNKYRGFKSIDEERAFRTGEGANRYDISSDINDAYERALRSLGIYTNNNINR